MRALTGGCKITTLTLMFTYYTHTATTHNREKPEIAYLQLLDYIRYPIALTVVSAAIGKVLHLMQVLIPAATVALNTCEANRTFIF